MLHQSVSAYLAKSRVHVFGDRLGKDLDHAAVGHPINIISEGEGVERGDGGGGRGRRRCLVHVLLYPVLAEYRLFGKRGVSCSPFFVYLYYSFFMNFTSD